jgi:hypothetical protein
MMSEQEKRDRKNSTLLAKAMGRYVEPVYNDELERQGLGGLLSWEEVPDKPGHTWKLYPVPDFYDPANMALAWRVHLWALNDDGGIRGRYYRWCRGLEERPWWIEAKAQRLWLNKIVELVHRRQYLEEASEDGKDD